LENTIAEQALDAVVPEEDAVLFGYGRGPLHHERDHLLEVPRKKVGKVRSIRRICC
jgi:hypothetical protein